jgi:hypothetical protein
MHRFDLIKILFFKNFKSKKKKEKKNRGGCLASLGVAEPPPWPKGWFGHPQTGRLGVAEPSPWALGVVRPPPRAKRPSLFFFLKKKYLNFKFLD